MKLNKVLPILLALLLLGCAQTAKPVQKGIVKYAKNFQLEIHNGYKILKVKENGEWKTYVLYHDKPPKGVKGIPIKIPVHRLVVMSSTHIAQLEAINGTDAIVGFMWGHRYKLYFPDVLKRIEEGKIVDLGPPSSPDYEKLVELHPDLVVIYVTKGTEKVREKLKELGIPYIVDSEWLETNPLGRAEWVKFFGALLDKDKQADEYFDKIVGNVTKIEDMVRGLKRPKVLWALVWRGKVYVPKGDSYVANEIKMAGGSYIFSSLNGTGSEIIDMEELLAMGQNTDVFIYPSYFVKSLKDIKNIDPRLGEIKAFKEGRVYNITPDYWQLGLLHADVVIKDLASIFHPELFKNYKPRFFVRLK